MRRVRTLLVPVVGALVGLAAWPAPAAAQQDVCATHPSDDQRRLRAQQRPRSTSAIATPTGTAPTPASPRRSPIPPSRPGTTTPTTASPAAPNLNFPSSVMSVSVCVQNEGCGPARSTGVPPPAPPPGPAPTPAPTPAPAPPPPPPPPPPTPVPSGSVQARGRPRMHSAREADDGLAQGPQAPGAGQAARPARRLLLPQGQPREARGGAHGPPRALPPQPPHPPRARPAQGLRPRLLPAAGWHGVRSKTVWRRFVVCA